MDKQLVQNHYDSKESYNKKVILSSHEEYKNFIKFALPKKLRRKRARKWLENNIEKILPVYCIDFAPIWGLLISLYSNDKRGKPPYDPQILLRSLLFMVSFQETSITKWVEELSCNEELLILCGIHSKRVPGVATHYDFLQRLENGAYQPKCQHHVPEALRRKSSSYLRAPRHKPDKEEEKSRVPDHRVVEDFVQETISHEAEPRLKNLQTLLNTILFDVAVSPSSKAGFLTNLNGMTVLGDGSVIPSACNYNGKTTCECRKLGNFKCDHDRFISDLSAEWGWDNRHKCLIFGYRFFQLVSGDNKHDLPVYLSIAPANKHEVLMAISAIDDMDKMLHESNTDYHLSRASFDALFDMNSFYKYLIHKKIFRYAIPYRIEPAACLELGADRSKFSADGIPLCPGGLPMRYHFKDGQGRRVYSCPVKRLARCHGKKVYLCHEKECPQGRICQPGSPIGPLIHVSADIDPRIHPYVARCSSEYKELRNLRSSCERSNSMKKYTYNMSHVRTRVMPYAFIRLLLMSILEHYKVFSQKILERPFSNPMELLV